MTTIAFDGHTLAVDRASWKNSYVWTEVRKLFELVLHEDAEAAMILGERKKRHFGTDKINFRQTWRGLEVKRLGKFGTIVYKFS